MLSGIKALLLDMNGTFMFGEDRFGEHEDFSLRYRELGGILPPMEINRIIRAAYEYLDVRYSNGNFRHCFPSLEQAIVEVAQKPLNESELERVIGTFSYHELGCIPKEYVSALRRLRKRFTLAAVIDIWAPKKEWLIEFDRAGISGLFSATSFSSDHGFVKPSPIPFKSVLDELGLDPTEAIMVGDSPRRDLGGARNAGIGCILVGGAKDPGALISLENLLQLCKAA